MNIPSGVKKRVAAATFEISKRAGGNGQCVLVEAGLIITAAHCVDWNCTGAMAQGGFFPSKIKRGKLDLTVCPRAVEPVSDIAVLDGPDIQDLPDESAAFEDLCDSITPVQLLRRTPKKNKPFPVWIRTHKKTWVVGSATYRSNSTFSYTTDSEIPCGTSGGAIVNHDGYLVGVVSNGTTSRVGCKYYSSAGLLSVALPAWILARTKRSQQLTYHPSHQIQPRGLEPTDLSKTVFGTR